MGNITRFLTSMGLAIIASASHASSDRPPALDCRIGPLHKTYGKTGWLVYACDDSRSIVIVSDQGNPASPFYFIVYVKPDGGMQLYGEGNGKESATRAAFDELKKLSQADVAALVEQARATQSGGDDRAFLGPVRLSGSAA
ncbi:hypothetical protein GCM10027084_03080 [Pseudoxanthomonas sangjuensis]|uniref:hypothetical protein n=1 Tax=Pseudoxanthomonas sangjuensis TaxID=1503750 RepID=UPI0013918682|nr:hypothetical protein [Pseudoxanthomonas sangjuensis]KAF1708277.1 hypothetical protein CSC71_11825 [Pseudoxanthomonas sangjuensis]